MRSAEGTEIEGRPHELQGVWSFNAKGSWANLSPIESEVVGYWHAARRLHYHIRGAPVVFGFVDHRPFAELYMKKTDVGVVPPHVQADAGTHGVSLHDA